MLAIYTVPYLVWRLARTDYFAPLVIVQIVAGILFGPAFAGRLFPETSRLTESFALSSSTAFRSESVFIRL